MDKDKCITNLRDLIKPSNTNDENEALLFAIMSVRTKSMCKNCEYREFTETFIDRVVDVMRKNGITSVEQLSKILKGGAE